MRRFWINLLAVVVLFTGGWLLWNQKQIGSVNDALRLAATQWKSLEFASASHSNRRDPTIRIASFNIQAFGASKVQDPTVANFLASIIREFDVIAIQEVRGQDQAVLSAFVALVNSSGRNFACIASEPVARNRYFERYAFLFDQDTVTLDGSHSYTVGDPDDVLHREPFVGWFRASAAEPTNAFTFSLVNVHLDSRQSQREVPYLAQLFRAIRGDGRGEDDIIIAGDFNADPEILQQLREQSGLTCLISDAPTNVQFTQQHDNLLINPLATTEFVARCGVHDFLKVFNLTIEQASSISDHLPVWADFSVTEGFGGNLTAAREEPTMK
jgi:deoxyribonuclease-1-like protein